MKIREMRLKNIRCFEDTDTLSFSDHNIFVGTNNSGKSTLLKAIMGTQIYPYLPLDARPGDPSSNAFCTLILTEFLPSDNFGIAINKSVPRHRVTTSFRGQADAAFLDQTPNHMVGVGQSFLPNQRPNHMIIPFLARRKAVNFSHDVSSNAHLNIKGTLESLYARIDNLITRGHPNHLAFCDAIDNIIGVPITTKFAQNGKEAGYYFDDNNFVTLEHMGDGVSEMLALIVELLTESNKIFVLEEPETNLHPKGLKSLMKLIVDNFHKGNQFFISTHSNVVVRELGGLESASIFRVFREGESHSSPSRVQKIAKNRDAHVELLRELGYEFFDFDLHAAWLFLEESSAETVIRDVLIPFFVPSLKNVLRTFSAAGVANLEPSVVEFQRLIVFVHLQPVYQNRFWVRADGDRQGKAVVEKLRSRFPNLREDFIGVFESEHFELYYPQIFAAEVKDVLSVTNQDIRKAKKLDLLMRVLEWTKSKPTEAQEAWRKSAKEPIELLINIRDQIQPVSLRSRT